MMIHRECITQIDKLNFTIKTTIESQAYVIIVIHPYLIQEGYQLLEQELMQQQDRQIKEINTHSAKLNPEDVPKKHPMEVPMCNTMGRPLPTT